MNVLLPDTSVPVDLERGEILETIFCLPFNFAVPSLLYQMELKDYGGDALINLGLRLEVLDNEEVAVHGVLWLFDRMHEEGVADGNKLGTSLRVIAAHPRCRLPKAEIEKRLQIYCDV